MAPMLTETFGNPSSIHQVGQRARRAMDDARESIAASLGVAPRTLVFTSGGTEANNHVINGVTRSRSGGPVHIITTPIEHDSVRRTCQDLESRGVAVTWLSVDAQGRVNPDEVRGAIRPETALISVMHANNEIGTVQPIAAIAAVANERGVPFHTDAVQTGGKLPLRPAEWGVDLMTLAVHKVHGPKGIGLLYIREGLELPALLIGGKHERMRRPGTENTAGIVGFAKAWELADRFRAEHPRRLAELRDLMQRRVVETLPDARVTAAEAERTPNTLHVCLKGLESEAILMNLDMLGIAASSGSACASGSREPSHVLAAMGIPDEWALGAVRFSLSRETTEAEIETAVSALARTAETLRAVAADWRESAL
jgi:cysteine desulfurase